LSKRQKTKKQVVVVGPPIKKRLGEMGLSKMKLGEMRLGEMLPNRLVASLIGYYLVVIFERTARFFYTEDKL